MTVNRWSETTNEIINYGIFIGHFHKLTLVLVVEVGQLTCVYLETIIFEDSERNEVDVDIEYRFEIRFDSLELDGLCTIDADYLHTIACTHTINIAVIAEDRQRVRSLPFRNIFWQLLELHKLFVSEFAEIVDNLECVFFVTLCTICRLINLGIF